MDRHPGDVDIVVIGLDQDWKMHRQLGRPVMRNRTWPGEIEAVQFVDEGLAYFHPQQWVVRAVIAPAEQAEVGRPAATDCSRAALAVHAASGAHGGYSNSSICRRRSTSRART